MTDPDEQDERQRLRAAENLGWLAESGTSYSKKRKFITGAQSRPFLTCCFASVV